MRIDARWVDLDKVPYIAITLADMPRSYLPSLVRTDVNGSREVRRAEAQAFSLGQTLITDFDAAMIGPVIYTFTNAYGDRTETTIPQPAWPRVRGIRRGWLRVAAEPAIAAQVMMATSWREDNQSGSTFAYPSSSTAPIVNQQPCRLRSGSFELLCQDYQHARAIRNVYASGKVVLLQQPWEAGMDLFHLATRFTLEALVGHLEWTLRVDYVEVDPSTIKRVAWTPWRYSDLEPGTYDELLAEWGTYDLLAIGDPR